MSMPLLESISYQVWAQSHRGLTENRHGETCDLVDPDAKNSNRLRQALEELDAPGTRSRPYAFPLTGTATSIGLPVILE